MAEVRRRRLSDPGANWIATPRGREWKVARVPLAPGAKRLRSQKQPSRRTPAG